MASSGKGGKGELVFGVGEKKKTKGLRASSPMSVETYKLEDVTAASATVGPPPGYASASRECG